MNYRQIRGGEFPNYGFALLQVLCTFFDHSGSAAGNCTFVIAKHFNLEKPLQTPIVRHRDGSFHFVDEIQGRTNAKTWSQQH
jgi:hypothetical protein